MSLGFMRRHRRWLFGFLWLVIAAFIILYIPAFDPGNAAGPGAVLAEVGDLQITVGEYNRAFLRQREIYQQMYQGRLDAEMMKRLGLEEQVFEALRDARVLQLEARRLGLSVSDDEVAKRLSTGPEFQENGRFMGGAELRRRLELQGMSVSDFEEQMRAQILREKVTKLITDGVQVTPDEVEKEFRRRTEQVKAEYVAVDVSRFLPEVTVTDEEVKAHFEARKDSYKFPERRVLSYVMVDSPALQPRVAVTDRDLETFYNANTADFQQGEQACASHVLIKVKQDEAGEGHPEAEAKTIAEGALAQVKAGADFATLAKTLSEDQGSGPNGGDLGCFERGRMVPEFENAAFSLQAGQTSDLVKSSFGYHIIRLNALTPETTQPFAQVKERIRQQLTSQKLSALVDEKSEALAAALAKGTKLDAAAREQGFAVQKTEPLARNNVKPPLASPALLARAFELKKGEVEKEAFQTGTGNAFIEVAEIQDPRLPDLKEVQDKVKADLQRARALEKAKVLATDLRSRAETLGLEKAATALSLTRKETPALVGRGQPLGDLGTAASLDEAAFSLAPTTLSPPVLTPNGYAVLRVLEKKEFDPATFAKEKPSIAASLREERQQQLFRAYMEEARKRFPVERHPEALRQQATS
jgi:peptidyl-prolyl cis-trans isomerase D